MSTDLRTVILYSADMDQLARFYAEVLELGPPTDAHPGHVGWNLPSLYFGLDQKSEPPAGYPGGITVWFTVADLEATYARSLARGATSVFEPSDRPWGARLACVQDPDGNTLGLSQSQ